MDYNVEWVSTHVKFTIMLNESQIRSILSYIMCIERLQLSDRNQFAHLDNNFSSVKYQVENKKKTEWK